MDKDDCPSIRLMKFLGKKWTLLILRLLTEHESCRFNDMADELGGISPKTLSERLKEFQRFGIVEKTTYSEVPPRTEYSLTDRGDELLECFQCMDGWMEKHDLA